MADFQIFGGPFAREKMKKRKSPKYFFLLPPGLHKTRGSDPQTHRKSPESMGHLSGVLRFCDFRHSRLKDSIDLAYTAVQLVYCWQEAKFTKGMVSSDQNPRVRRREPGNIARRPPAMFLTELGRSRAPTGPYGPRDLDFSMFRLLSVGFARGGGLQPMTPL